jgi:hypothetical protein
VHSKARTAALLSAFASAHFLNLSSLPYFEGKRSKENYRFVKTYSFKAVYYLIFYFKLILTK